MWWQGYGEYPSKALIYPHTKSITSLKPISSTITSSIYMRQNKSHYKTHGENQSTGDTSIHILDSRQNVSTRCLMMRPQSRAKSHISERIQDQQKPTKTLDTSIQTWIRSKNKITKKKSLVWPQWKNTTIYTQTRQECFMMTCRLYIGIYVELCWQTDAVPCCSSGRASYDIIIF